MDVHRLRSVIDLIISEHGRLGIDAKLAELLQALGACASKPSSRSDERFRSSLIELLTALRRARTNDFVESNRRILVEIQGEQITGNGLAQRILQVANERPFLADRARDAYVDIADDLQRRLGACAATRAAFDEFNLGPVTLESDEYELGLLLPDSLVRGDLARLYKELTDWNHMFRELIPVVSSQPAAVVLRTFTASRFELSVKLDRRGALAIGTMVAGLYELGRKVQANRDKAAELERDNYPADIVRRMVEYEKTMVPLEIKAIRKLVTSKFLGAGGRRKDVEKVLDRSLRFMALRMREGVEVEVLGSMTGDAVAAVDTAPPVTHHVRAALHTAGAGIPKPKATSTEQGLHVSPAVAAAREEKAPQMPLSQITGETDELAA